MAIVSSLPKSGSQITLYDIPESDLEKYKISQEKAAQMFPEEKGPANRTEMGEMNSDVQGYADLYLCEGPLCNAYGCVYGRCVCDAAGNCVSKVF